MSGQEKQTVADVDRTLYDFKDDESGSSFYRIE